MLWLLLDALIAVLALVGLTVVLLRLWRTIKALGTQVSASSEAVGTASDSLAAAQAAAPRRR